jgi:hypothetical protein
MKRSRKQKKQNEDEVESMKVEDGIGNIRTGRGISITGSRNVKANGESLRPLDVAGGASTE